MKLEGEYIFDGSREKVWNILRDPEALAAALPGVQELERVDESEYEGQMHVRIGPVSGSFSGKLVVSDEVPPQSYVMSVEGRGAPGFGKGVGHVMLVEHENGKTLMKYSGDVEVGGRIAGVGQRLIDTASRSMITQALESLNSLLQARTQTNIEDPVLILTKNMAGEAFSRQAAQVPAVTTDDVEAAIPSTLETSRNSLEWLWDGLPPAERVVASALAKAGPSAITQDELEQLLHNSGVRVVIRELRNAPRLLQEWDLVEPVDGGYRFRVDLLRRWIVEHKPLNRVQEELDRIEPVAENLYRAAVGLYRGGHFDQAITPLRQAVALNPNHVAANQLLADVLLAQEHVDEALQLLEHLHKYQPMAACSRLVQALLMKAQASENNEEQLTLLQRVLDLDPAQPEALDRVSEIREEIRREELLNHLKALEKLEAEGRYSEALDFSRDLSSEYGDIRDWASDLDRLERKTQLADLYQRGLGALHSGDQLTAQALLAQVVALEPTYMEATRYLHLAVTGVDVADLQTQLEGLRQSTEMNTTEVASEPNDLKRIEGIGPKLASVLQEAGIRTFLQLADTDVARLEQVLEEADPRLRRLADPSSWPVQARLAAEGRWQDLEELQLELRGGRRS